MDVHYYDFWGLFNFDSVFFFSPVILCCAVHGIMQLNLLLGFTPL